MAARVTRPSAPVRALQLGLFVAADAAWISAWSASFGAWSGAVDAPPLGLGAVIALLVAGLLTVRTLRASLASAWLVRAALLSIGLGLAFVAVVGTEWWVRTLVGWGDSARVGRRGVGAEQLLRAAFVLLGWWRGVAIGRAMPTVGAARSSFGGATLALAVLLLANLALPIVALLLTGIALGSSSALEGEFAQLRAQAIPAARLFGSVLVVLFAGLVGMSVARVLLQGEDPRHRQSLRLGVSASWLLLLLGSVAGLLLATLAVIVALPFGPPRTAMAPPPDLAERPPPSLTPAPIPTPPDQPAGRATVGPIGPVQRVQPTESREGPDTGPSRTGPVLLRLLVALLAALLLWGSVRLARRTWRDRATGLLDRLLSARGRSPGDDVEEVRDFVWSWSALAAGIAALLDRFIGRRAQPLARGATESGRAADGDGAARSVRELYRELLTLGASLGRDRLPHETSREYERALAGLEPLASGRSELRELTEVYAEARYGPEPPTREEQSTALRALTSLKKVAGRIGEER